MSTMHELFGDVIHEYSRAQAIEDGVLVDLMQPELAKLVREAGFKVPVAMTTTAFAKCVHPIDAELPEGQDVNGRLWDVLWMLRCAIRTQGASGSEIRFSLRVVTAAGVRPELVQLKSVIGPGDNMEPVMTIMFPEEN